RLLPVPHYRQFIPSCWPAHAWWPGKKQPSTRRKRDLKMIKILSLLTLTLLTITTSLAADDYYGSIDDLKLAKPEDKVDMPSVPAPEGASVLFDGKSLQNWRRKANDETANWKLLEGGIMQVNGTGDIMTREEFGGHFKLHVE